MEFYWCGKRVGIRIGVGVGVGVRKVDVIGTRSRCSICIVTSLVGGAGIRPKAEIGEVLPGSRLHPRRCNS